ncbi:unnamed protein product, partial [Meganyctiphanes norvegica]
MGAGSSFTTVLLALFVLANVLHQTIGGPMIWHCQFESGMCAWNSTAEGELMWGRSSQPYGGNEEHDTGPPKAHGGDWYAYLDTKKGIPGETANLTHDMTEAKSKEACFSIWLNRHGAEIGSLTFEVELNSGDRQFMFAVEGDVGNEDWHHRKFTVPSDSAYLRMIGTKGDGPRGFIALDDLNLDEGPCVDDPLPPSYLKECGFEYGNCDLTFPESKGFKWHRKNNSNIGYDHTTLTKAGHVIALDIPDNCGSDDSCTVPPVNTTIQTKIPSIDLKGLDNSSKLCVHMWVSLIGGQGEIFIIKANNHWIFRLDDKGGLDQEWLQASHEFDSLVTLGDSLNVSVQVRTSGSPGVHVAIDDITIFNGECPSVLHECNLESGMNCGWQNEFHSDMNWVVQKGPAPTSEIGSGPNIDHTLGQSDPFGGHYLLLNSLGADQGSRATLRSDTLPKGETFCLSFWYYMNNRMSGDLTILMQDSFGAITGQYIKLWHLSGDQTGVKLTWKFGSLPVHTDAYTWLIIEGVTGRMDTGDIALDDIKITLEECTIEPPEAGLEPTPTP